MNSQEQWSRKGGTTAESPRSEERAEMVEEKRLES
jgi:hypothetical protein